jgi:hypothetical protein
MVFLPEFKNEDQFTRLYYSSRITKNQNENKIITVFNDKILHYIFPMMKRRFDEYRRVCI